MAVLSHDGKVAEVWFQLAPVTDPELDESVTELGFVTAVTLDEKGVVQVSFRLPTYWCAANFAFLMADDMARAVRALRTASKSSFGSACPRSSPTISAPNPSLSGLISKPMVASPLIGQHTSCPVLNPTGGFRPRYEPPRPRATLPCGRAGA